MCRPFQDIVGRGSKRRKFFQIRNFRKYFLDQTRNKCSEFNFQLSMEKICKLRFLKFPGKDNAPWHRSHPWDHTFDIWINETGDKLQHRNYSWFIRSLLIFDLYAGNSCNEIISLTSFHKVKEFKNVPTRLKKRNNKICVLFNRQHFSQKAVMLIAWFCDAHYKFLPFLQSVVCFSWFI